MSNINITGALGVNPYKMRFSDAPWFLRIKEEYGLIIGCGGIGSNLAFLLNSMGLNFTIFDQDLIGEENLGETNNFCTFVS